MPVYAKSVKSSDPRFRGRVTEIYTWGSNKEPADPGYPQVTTIPIPDDVVLCNGCNQNVTEGYLIYFSKMQLQQDHPYDMYCESCMKKYFPKAITVLGG